MNKITVARKKGGGEQQEEKVAIVTRGEESRGEKRRRGRKQKSKQHLSITPNNIPITKTRYPNDWPLSHLLHNNWGYQCNSSSGTIQHSIGVKG